MAMQASYRSHHLELLNLLFKLESGSICSVVGVWWLSGKQFNIIECRKTEVYVQTNYACPAFRLSYRTPQIKLPYRKQQNWATVLALRMFIVV